MIYIYMDDPKTGLKGDTRNVKLVSMDQHMKI